jgi:hypothetical protein
MNLKVMMHPVVDSLRIGWESAKANRLPMVILWTLAAVLSVSYRFAPPVAEMLRPLAEMQAKWGPLAGAANQIFFCGVVPGLFMLLVKSIRPDRALAKFALQTLWSGMWGAVYFWFYALQARMFGAGHEWQTLLAKTAFDQFAWTPLVAVPLNGAFYLWMGSGFSFATLANRLRSGFVRTVVLPNLVSSWCVWIPIVAAVYAFPGELQVQVLGLVCSFWSLMCLEIGRRCAAASARFPI